MSALDRAHHRLRRHRRRPTFDGYYVTWTDLRADPALAPPRPTSHEGRLRAAPSTLDPVAWHTLAQCGVPCRGPAVADLGVWTDPAVLRGWVLRNLDDYWGRLRRRGGRLLSPHGLASLSDYAVEWRVPGLSRIHYTVVTGEVTGKEGGVRHALATFPSRWQRILEESLRVRTRTHRRSRYGNPLQRRRDLLAFWDMLYDDAQRAGDRRSPRDPV